MKHRPQPSALLAAALQAAAGNALVLDARLRVVGATASLEALLGAPAPIGASAPALLCGDGPQRPFAEALAAGVAMQTVIPRPQWGARRAAPARARMVRVQAKPLWLDAAGGKPQGWLVTMEPTAHEHASTEPELFHGMWTASPAMKRCFEIIKRAASEEVAVLVRGETGTGKELVARALHAMSPRQHGPFRAINCAALPANLLESELFGHAKGAFTGALKDTPGHIQLAHNGTLFLDEVAEMPLELQAKLLRVLETHSVIPVGGRDAVPVNVRIISATHRALRRDVDAGRFRADLMYRLRVIPIFLPPLRERQEDIELLTDKLLRDINAGSARRAISEVAPAARKALHDYAWPGNIRELRNALAYAHVMGDHATLSLGDLPPEIATAWRVDEVGEADEVAPAAGVLAAPVAGRGEVLAVEPMSVEAHLAQRIAHALARTNGNKDRAAKLLGMSRITLWRKLKQLDLS